MIAVGSRLGSGLAGLAALVGLFGASGPANGSSPSLAGPQEIRAAIQRPLVLDPGRCEVTLVVEANFSVRRRFEPVSLAPDIHCGIVPRFMLGITHSARSLSLIDSGDGLCLSGEGAGCPHLYDSTALDALVRLREGDAAVAARARLVAASYDPLKPSLRLGALVRLRAGRVALVLDPQLALGLDNRDRGNRDQLSFPIVGQLQPDTRVMVTLRTGVRGELATFGDAFAVPVAAGVELSPAPEWDIGLEAGFPRLFGPLNTFNQRHLAFYVTYRASAPCW